MRAGVGLFVLTLAAGSLGLGGAAVAGGASCSATGQISHVYDVNGDFPSYIKRYSAQAPNGARWSGTHMDGTHFYELHGVRLAVDFGGTTYEIYSNAVVTLDCAGVADRASDAPDVRLLHGSITVHTSQVAPGNVSSEEGRYGPVPGGESTDYFVFRKLATSSATARDKMRWFLDKPDQPTGKTKVKSVVQPYVGVNPNVGPKPGTVRKIRQALLTTTTSYGQGTAVYHH